LGGETVFADMTNEQGEEALDGLKIDASGNLFFSGPGGAWIISSAGKRLGLLKLVELPANMAWGGDAGKDLYFTARAGIDRVRTKTGRATTSTMSARGAGHYDGSLSGVAGRHEAH